LGMIHYVTDNDVGHAIIFAVVREDGAYHVIYMEPQTQQEAFLSKEEKKSCDFFYV